MKTKVYDKTFTEKELTILREVVEMYLNENDNDEEVRDLYLTELGYDRFRYIKI